MQATDKKQSKVDFGRILDENGVLVVIGAFILNLCTRLYLCNNKPVLELQLNQKICVVGGSGVSCVVGIDVNRFITPLIRATFV